MRMTWNKTLAAAAVCGALSAACGGNAGDPAANERRAQDDRSGSQQVAVTGCVATASGTSTYALSHVRMAPLPEQPSDAPTSHGGVITEGAWVKLRVDDDDKLGEHVGRMVTVVGRVSDTGRNTIGTSGQTAAPDEPEGRKDASRAASSEHYSDKVAKEAGPMGQQSLANETAPEITVERVNSTGKPCPGR